MWRFDVRYTPVYLQFKNDKQEKSMIKSNFSFFLRHYKAFNYKEGARDIELKIDVLQWRG